MLRPRLRALQTRAVYALDNLLTRSPLWQLGALLLLAVLAVLFLGLVAYGALRRDEIPGGQHPLWWVLTLVMDGGTLAGAITARWPALLLSIFASIVGVLLLSLVTAAFASKMADRLHEVRSGRSPVIERDHVLILGFDRKVPLIARELARSRQKVTLVILAQEGRERLDALLRPLRRLQKSRLRLVIRSGDPRSDHALQLVAARQARVIIVVPPPHLDHAHQERWTLSTLLAVRHRLGDGSGAGPHFRGHIVVEASRGDARDLLLLSAEGGAAATKEPPIEVIASDDLMARMLAQSLRQEGIYHALQKMLTFDECEIYLDPVPGALIGRTFDGAHEVISGAVLLGVRRKDGTLYLNASADEALFLEAEDRLVVLASSSRGYRIDGHLPTLDLAPEEPALAERPPELVALLGLSPNLPRMVEELARWLPPGSRIRVIGPAEDRAGERILHALPQTLREVSIECDPRPPQQLIRDGDDTIYGADAVVILGAEEGSEEGDDAAALSLLLTLRQGTRRLGRAPKRIVTEIRDPRTAHHVSSLSNDILVGKELVALLLAQQALDPQLASVYGELLSPWGNELAIHPLACYAVQGRRFAEVAAAARHRGEVALGFFVAGQDGARPEIVLNPPRDREIPPKAAVVVLMRPAELKKKR